MSETVKFRSGADTCVGVLTRPKNVSAPVPVVIMAGGWCYTKEVVMPHYSRFFEDLGCAHVDASIIAALAKVAGSHV